MADDFERVAQQIDWSVPYQGDMPIGWSYFATAVLHSFDVLGERRLVYPSDLTRDDFYSEALSNVLSLEDDLRCNAPSIPTELARANCRAFDAAVGVWRSSLPFAEGELLPMLAMTEVLAARDEAA